MRFYPNKDGRDFVDCEIHEKDNKQYLSLFSFNVPLNTKIDLDDMNNFYPFVEFCDDYIVVDVKYEYIIYHEKSYLFKCYKKNIYPMLSVNIFINQSGYTNLILANNNTVKIMTISPYAFYNFYKVHYELFIEEGGIRNATQTTSNILEIKFQNYTKTFELRKVMSEKDNFEKTVEKKLLDILGKDVIGEIKKYLTNY